jgi:hypothetical protein
MARSTSVPHVLHSWLTLAAGEHRARPAFLSSFRAEGSGRRDHGLSNPVDPNSEPTGNTIFVLSKVYETPAGVPEHWRLAIEGWQDLHALMDWSSRVKVGTLHSGSVVQGLW